MNIIYIYNKNSSDIYRIYKKDVTAYPIHVIDGIVLPIFDYENWENEKKYLKLKFFYKIRKRKTVNFICLVNKKKVRKIRKDSKRKYE